MSRKRVIEIEPKPTFVKTALISTANAQNADIQQKNKSSSSVDFGAKSGQNSPVLQSPDLFYGIKHNEIIKRLIECESQWTNRNALDSNGKMSRGILQFQDTTWAEFSRQAGVKGSPLEPRKAILVANYMIEHGLLKRWSCAKIQGLI